MRLRRTLPPLGGASPANVGSVAITPAGDVSGGVPGPAGRGAVIAPARGVAFGLPPAAGAKAVGFADVHRLIERGPLVLLILFVAALFGAGCAPLPPIPGGGGGGADQPDGPGDPRLAAGSVEERVRDLPKSARGNMAEYTVFGQRYRTLDSAEGFRERGVASWYGAKFHGRDTSSGEPFDMHAMTAAHRHLPLPTFVRVTNVANGRSAVVKVNDRGPFADDRVIDLSYAAAARLDMLDAGTAEVTLEALSTHPPADAAGSLAGGASTPRDPGSSAVAATPGNAAAAVPDGRSAVVAGGGPEATASLATSAKRDGAGGRPPAGDDGRPVPDVIQLGAFADDVRAATLARRVGPHLGAVPRVEHDAERALWRVRIGPIADAAAMEAALAGLAAAGIEDYALITTTPR